MTAVAPRPDVHPGTMPRRGADTRTVPHLPAVRGGLRARDHASQRRTRVTRIRGDQDDVFSHGFICPKGSTLRQLHEDPDRLRPPLVSATAIVEGDLGRGVRRGRRHGCGAVIDAHGREARRRLRRQPQRPQPRRAALPQAAAAQGARHHQRVLGQHRRPAAQGDLVRR